MGEVFALTLGNVLKSLLFVSLGYFLCRSKKLPADTPKVLSTITTMLFYPAYSINNLSKNFTIDKVADKLTVLGLGIVCLGLVFLLALLFSKFLGRNDLEKRTIIYAFTISNYVYFGYPLIESVFGPELLSDVIVYTIPSAIAANSVFYMILSGQTKLSWKRIFTSPLILAPFIGSALGLSGLHLPKIVQEVLSSCGGCMSPVSMLLMGFILGKLHITEAFKDGRSYIMSLIRMIVIPGIFGVAMYFIGLRGIYLLIPLLVLSMPIGVNIVVFPESCGIDARDNAKTVFLSYILAAGILPLTFSLISHISGI